MQDDVTNFFNILQGTRGTNAKMDYVRQKLSDKTIAKLLKMTFNPYMSFNVVKVECFDRALNGIENVNGCASPFLSILRRMLSNVVLMVPATLHVVVLIKLFLKSASRKICLWREHHL